ncbi:MAG: hypothetical protein WBY94_27485 [Polyangiaceae bacterium]
MAALPRSSQTPATRRHYAQALRKLLVYAVYPLSVLPALPIPKGWLPKGSSGKAKSWVYPSEDLALMKCTPARSSAIAGRMPSCFVRGLRWRT